MDVDRNGRAQLQFIETNLVRWAHLDLSIQPHSRMDSLVTVLKTLGVFNLLLLAVCAWFTWGAKAGDRR